MFLRRLASAYRTVIDKFHMAANRYDWSMYALWADCVLVRRQWGEWWISVDPPHRLSPVMRENLAAAPAMTPSRIAVSGCASLPNTTPRSGWVGNEHALTWWKWRVICMNYLPEPLHLLCLGCAVFQSCVRFPIIHIDATDATDDKLKFLFVKWSQQLRRYELVETLKERDKVSMIRHQCNRGACPCTIFTFLQR